MRIAVPILAASLLLTGCDAPLGAIRRSPPTGVEARIVDAGTKPKSFSLEGTMGTFRLADALAKDNVLLVFYRGHW